MKSNNIFNINRFLLVMRNDLILNYKKYLLTIAGALIAGFVIIYMQMPTKEFAGDFKTRYYYPIFTLCLIGLATFIGSSFQAFESKKSATGYLLIPSSTFEKFLSEFLIRIVAGIALFFIIFWLDAYIARETALQVLSKNNFQASIAPFEFSTMFNNDVYDLNKPALRISVITFIFSIAMYFFSVRLFFRKMAFVKTAISLAALLYFILLLVLLFSHIFYPETKGWDLHLNYYKVYDNYKNIDLWMYGMSSIPWLFLLPLGYFKLKEKQI